MSFTLKEFAVKRPYLFHLTAREHRELIKDQSALLPARDLFEKAGESDWTRQKRRMHVEISVNGQKIKVRDQAPLHEGNLELSGGWSFADFIAHLNRRVFFWPGRQDGLPIDHGKRHYGRYAGEAPIVVRLRTEHLFAANTGVKPEFCRYNSGSPRWTYGKPSPRGPETFMVCVDAPFNIAEVVEVTFPAPIVLPKQVEVADSPSGPWTIL